MLTGWWNAFLDWLRSLFFKREMEICLIGLNYAGKSTLVEVLASGHFNQDLFTTVGFNMRKVTKGGVTIKLWDVGGQPRFRSMWERYCRGVQAVVYVVDAAETERIEEAATLLHDLAARPTLSGVPLLVLGNKADLPSAIDATALRERMRLAELPLNEVAVYSISCKNSTNINLVLEWLLKHSKSP